MKKSRREKGLTLIEILLALVVMVIGLVGVLALFPPAIDSAKTSMEETQAAILAESIAGSLQTAVKFAQANADGSWTAQFMHDGVGNAKIPITLPAKPVPPLVSTLYPSATEMYRLGNETMFGTLHTNQVTRLNADASDPYTQFGFSLEIQKVDTLRYLVGQPKPGGVGNYSEDDVYKMEKLYEIQVFVYRSTENTDLTADTVPRAGAVRVERVTHRVAVQ